jgi:hypothetical protein
MHQAASDINYRASEPTSALVANAGVNDSGKWYASYGFNAMGELEDYDDSNVASTRQTVVGQATSRA